MFRQGRHRIQPRPSSSERVFCIVVAAALAMARPHLSTAQTTLPTGVPDDVKVVVLQNAETRHRVKTADFEMTITRKTIESANKDSTRTTSVRAIRSGQSVFLDWKGTVSDVAEVGPDKMPQPSGAPYLLERKLVLNDAYMAYWELNDIYPRVLDHLSIDQRSDQSRLLETVLTGQGASSELYSFKIQNPLSLVKQKGDDYTWSVATVSDAGAGADLLKIIGIPAARLGTNSLVYEWFFDPSKGGVLVREVLKTITGTPTFETRVDWSAPSGDQVFFPERIQQDRFRAWMDLTETSHISNPHEIDESTTVIYHNVKLNGPTSPSQFQIAGFETPPNTRVMRITPDGSQTLWAIEAGELVPMNVANQFHRDLANQTVSSANPEIASSKIMDLGHQNPVWYISLAVAGIGLIAGIVLTLRYFNRSTNE